MKRLLFIEIITIVVSLLLMPLVIYAQAEQATTTIPPVGQTMVREGNFAVKLVSALALGETENEVEAENILGSVGISPRNGWIADYPVTPDIMGEIQKSVIDAVDSKKLSMSKDEALKRFQDVTTETDLDIRSYTGEPQETTPPDSENYANPTVINNYYNNQGPPIVTYYAPPPDYYYLYAWVPYPFWWFDFWFPGFFILNDFHRSVIIHKRVVFISNHFNDFRHHRVFRIDPVDRFHGRTFAGIGSPKRGRFLSPGVKRGSESIFNRNRTRPPSMGRTFTPPSRGRTVAPPSGGRTITPPSRGRPMVPPSGGRTIAPPPPSGGRTVAPPSRGRPMVPPSGGRAVTPPSGGRGSFEKDQRR